MSFFRNCMVSQPRHLVVTNKAWKHFFLFFPIQHTYQPDYISSFDILKFMRLHLIFMSMAALEMVQSRNGTNWSSFQCIGRAMETLMGLEQRLINASQNSFQMINCFQMQSKYIVVNFFCGQLDKQVLKSYICCVRDA